MQVNLTNVRISFPDLFTAKAFKDNPKKSYGAAFLIPNGSKQQAAIDKVVMELATEAWKTKAEKTVSQLKNDTKACCWYDGDLKEFDGYEGHQILTAKRGEEKGRPTVVDRKGSPLTESDAVIYGGCYVNAKVDIWIQDNEFGKGIRAVLLGVQFVKDGDSFGASVPKTVEFEALEDEEESLV